MKTFLRRSRSAWLAACAAAAALFLPQMSLAALPAGFTETTINRPDGQPWQEAVGLAFAPNGRLFVWERNGSVWVIDAASPLGSRFLDMRNEVAAYRDHGMLGFALHPNFVNNGYVYVLFTVERHHLVNCDSPPLGPPVCGPGYTPGTHTPFQPTIGRVVRYQATRPLGDSDYSRANGIDTSTRTVLLGESWWFSDPNQLNPAKPRNTGCPILHESHGVGSLVFGQDGSLLVTCGDGASYNGVDWGPGSDSYHSQAIAEGIIRPAEDVGSYRVQMVNSLNGKILRLNPDTGDGLASNPFYDPLAPRAAKSRVWALGLRNPFRFTLRPGTGSHNPGDGNPGVLYVGDVGWSTWEDLNVVRFGGENFGWPLFEGQEQQNDYYSNGVAENEDAPNPLYNGTTCTRQYFQFRELLKQDTRGTPSWPNPCNAGQQITSADVFLHQRPALDWHHNTSTSRFAAFQGNTAVAWPIGSTAPDSSIVLGSPFPGNSSTGGIWYEGSDFPAQYHDTYFHGEYGGQWIKNFVFDSNNTLKEVRNFGDNLGGIVSIASNPVSGGLYYIAWTAYVKKISYTPNTNVPPNAVATVDRQYGPSPLTVNFDASLTTDANGGTITYTWNFGDGSPTASGVTASHTYTATGLATFTATLTARDSGGLTSTATVLISPNNTPPDVTITSPLDGDKYSILAPTQLPLQADIIDAETGPGSVSCSWITILHHNSHTHQDPPVPSCSTTTQISPLGCDSETYYYELQLTVSDPQGLTVRKSSKIYPDCPSQDTSPPTAPNSLLATVAGYNQVNLSWVASDDNVGVTGYQVERCQGAGCSNFSLVGVSGTTAFAATGLLGSTSYSFRVRASDAAGNFSNYSNVVSAVTAAPPPVQIRVNAGGPAYMDTVGNLWSADTAFNTGHPLAWPDATIISGTSDPALFRTERWDDGSAPELQYSFNVPNGSYQVKLHFAENYAPLFAVGKRVFGVQVEGVTVIPALDVFAEAGANAALVKTIDTTVTDSTLDIVLVHNIEDPEINAIEIVSAAATPDTTPPSTPVLATPVVAGATQLNLSWSAATDNIGVTGYQLERCQGAGCSNFLQVATPTGTAFNDIGLTAATSYSYRVRATDAAGNLGAWSNVATATTQASADTTPPTVPVLAAPVVVSATQIDLAWSASTDAVGVTGYLIERCQGAGCSSFAQVASVGGGVTAFSNTGLAGNTSYSYRVRATDAAGNLSGWSNTGTGVTPTAPDTTPPTAPVLAAPLPASSTQISLSWSAASDAVGVTGYQVERCQGAGCSAFTLVITVAGNVLTYADPGLTPATSYSYRVRATDAAGNFGPWSNTGTAVTQTPPDTTPPTAPVLAAPTVVSSTQINLSWSASTDNLGVTGYVIERCAGVGCSSFAQIGSSATTSFSSTPLTPSTAYSFRVRATDAAGNFSAWSNIASASTPAPPAVAIRINVGGPSYTDSTGNSWLADTGFNTGHALGWPGSTSIAGTSDPTLYRTERWDDSGSPEMQYSITVPRGTYTVRLHFAENYPPLFAVGQRIFGIQIEGVTVEPALDVFSLVGAHTALVKSYTATVNDSAVTITFLHNVEDPLVNAIEVISQGSTDTTPPTAPVLAAPLVAGPARLDLAWSASTDDTGVTGYQVERCQGAGCSNFVQVGTSATTAFSNTGLTPSTSYSYRVRASDAAGNFSAYSNIATATTAADTTPPGASTLAAPTVVSATQVNLAWSAAGDDIGVTGYQVERCQGAGCTSFAVVGSTAGTTFNNTGLAPSTSYSYRVQATDAAGNLGPYSNVVSATTLAAPDTTPPTAPVLAAPVVAGYNQLNLGWVAASDNVAVTGYRIERCQGAGCSAFVQVQSVGGATLSAIDTGLAPSTSYSYRVRATDAAGNLGPYSNVASATTAADTTPPGTPVLAAPGVVGASRIDLTWTATTDNVGVSGYQVERCQGAGCSAFTLVTTVGGSTTAFSNTGLAAGTAYSYRIRATDAAGNLGGYSNVVSATTSSAPVTVIRRNVGGPAYTDASGNVWAADSGYNTGHALAWPGSTSIAGTSDPTLYRTERWDDSGSPEMQYSFTVPNGSYQVRLHFAENYSPLFAVGQRIFGVQIEGTTVIPSLDIFAEAGARTALVKTATVTVSDGTLNIVFLHQVEDPEVNAIEIISQ